MGSVSLGAKLNRYRSTTCPRTLYGAYMVAYNTDLDPNYQRGHVWTDEQRGLYIGAVIEGRPVGVIILHDNFAGVDDSEWNEADPIYTAIDGKQRCTAILKWFHNEIPAILLDGTRFKFKELDRVSARRAKNSTTVAIGTVKGMTHDEQIDLYLAVNTGGTLHTAEELDRVHRLRWGLPL